MKDRKPIPSTTDKNKQPSGKKTTASTTTPLPVTRPIPAGNSKKRPLSGSKSSTVPKGGTPAKTKTTTISSTTRSAESRSRTSRGSGSKRNSASSNTNPEGEDDDEAENEPTSKINNGFLVGFVQAFRTEEFKKRWNHTSFRMSEFCDYIMEVGGSSSAPAPIAQLHRLAAIKSTGMEKKRKEKEARTNKEGVVSDSKDSKKTTPRTVLDTQQVRQIARASLAVHTFAVNDERVYQLFHKNYVEGNMSPRFLVGTLYIPRILGAKSSKDPASKYLKMKEPTKIEVILFFHSIRIYHTNNDTFTRSASARNKVKGTRVGFAVQTITLCWSRLVGCIQAENLGRLSNLIMPYIMYDSGKGMFRVLKSKDDGFSHSRLERTLEDAQVQEEGATGVSVTAWNRSDELDTAIRYIVDMMFTHLEALIRREYLYSANERDLSRWNVLEKYAVPAVATELPPVFYELPDNIAATLKITKPSELESSPERVNSNIVDVDAMEIDEVMDDQEHMEQPSKRLKLTEEPGDDQNEIQPSGIVVKNEPINTTIKPGRSRDMSNEANDAMTALGTAMEPYCALVDDDFRELITVSTDLFGINLENSVDFIFTDPPYNIRDVTHDKFDADDMKDLVEFFQQTMKEGAHGIIFCAFSQFEQYRKLLLDVCNTELDYDVDDTGNTSTRQQVFQVEAAPIFIVKKDWNFHSRIGPRSVGKHTNIVEVCLHFWRNGGSEDDIKSRLDFKTPCEFGGKNPSWTNVITEVPLVSGEEIVYDQQASGRKRVRPEQKPIKLIKYFLNKFTKPGDLVVDPCAGTFATGKACLEMEHSRRFIGSDRDTNCVAMVEDKCIETFARQVVSPHSDIKPERLTIRKAAAVVCRELDRLEVKRRADDWTTPTGLVPTQNFPPHIVEYLCQYYNDFSLYQHRHIAMNKWSAEWIRRMNSVDVNSVRAAEAAHLKLLVQPSTINHPTAGLGVFARKVISKDDIVGNYYGALVYGDIGTNKRLQKRYGSGILSVSSSEFDKWGNQIDHEFVDIDGNKYNGFIAPAPFCVCRYINDSRYLEGDRTPLEKRKKENRRPNVEFRIDKKAKFNRDFEKYTAIHLVAICDINHGSELFVNYGSNYTFPTTE